MNATDPNKRTGVSDFDPGDETLWTMRVETSLRAALATYGATPHLAIDEGGQASDAISTDWTAFPSRIASCLTGDRARLLLDWRTAAGDQGRQYQEEYAEWRTVRSDDGKIQRFELTTELPDYWRWLAGHNPSRTLELIATFAGEESVDPKAVYGERDPFGASVSDVERETRFAQSMLQSGESPYNSGLRAICCMRQPTNTLDALLGLIVASARVRLARKEGSGLVRCANAAEVIPRLEGAAELGRNSDPVLVEKLTRLAFEGRRFALDGPPGVYIHGIQIARLITPDGSPVAREWFSLQRTAPIGGSSSPGTVRAQRLVFEIPREHGFCISDLTDVATGEPISWGADLAELVQLAVYVRAGAPGVIASCPEDVPLAMPSALAAVSSCEELQAAWRELQAGSATPAAGSAGPEH